MTSQNITYIRERSSVDLGADIIEDLAADDAHAIEAVLQLVLRASAVDALQHLASVNHGVRATGRDARDMAAYARSELERLGVGLASGA